MSSGQNSSGSGVGAPGGMVGVYVKHCSVTTERRVVQAGRLLPALLIGLAVVTIAFCVIFSAAAGHWWGGLDYPYISDTGREKPEYYVFAIGLTIVAGASVVGAVLELVFLRRHIASAGGSKPLLRSSAALAILHVVAAPGLVVLAIVPTTSSPAAHIAGAVWFFVWTIGAVCTATAVVWRLYRHHGLGDLRWSARCKLVLTGLAVIAFLIYIPLGMSVACSAEEDDGVYDFRECPEVHTMRSVSQHITVILFLAIMATYAMDVRPPLGDNAASSSEASADPESPSLSFSADETSHSQQGYSVSSGASSS